MTKELLLAVRAVAAIFLAIFSSSMLLCSKASVFSPSNKTDSLSVADVRQLTAQAIEQASRLNVNAEISVVDRAGNVLAVYRMNGAQNSNVNPLFGSAARARTAAYLSSNAHAFSSLTACFLTRSHFPPSMNNTPGGPLYGVVWSQLGGGDVQPNGGALPGILPTGQPGLTGIPGGFPLYKNGVLVGGLGVSGGMLDVPSTLSTCAGASQDEQISLSALTGFVPDQRMTADNVTIDGVALFYSNVAVLSQRYSFAVDGTLVTMGNFDPRYSPVSGTVFLLSDGYRKIPNPGMFLNSSEVDGIVRNAAVRSSKTRSQLRRPPNSPARVWIAVVDVDGKILALWTDGDAANFGMDVSVQKARTAVAFSDPSNQFGIQIRSLLNLSDGSNLSVSTRAVGYLAQDWYPPGIDMPSDAMPGPLFEGANFAWQQRLSAMPGLPPYGNGITIFPGGISLWKNGKIVGAVGVSGDGVDQDDYIAAAGALGYEAPLQWRTDFISYSGARLPYLKFPRSPDLP